MKHTFKYLTLIWAIAIVPFSCRKAEISEPGCGRIVVKASEEATKTHLDNYAVLWDSSETMKLFCAPSAEAVPVSSVSETAKVSDDSKTAEFAFNFSYTDEFTNCFIYGGIYPSGAVSSDASATMSTIEVNLPSEQSPTESAYDPSAFIMVARPQTFSAEKTEISQYFRRAVALNNVTLKSLAIAQGEKVSSVKFTVPQSLTFSGKRQINLATGKSGEFTGESNSIQLNYSSAFTPSDGTFNAWFTSWNTSLEIGQILTVEVTTDMATYKREITLDKAVSFKEREYNTLTVNMSSATRTPTLYMLGPAANGWGLDDTPAMTYDSDGKFNWSGWLNKGDLKFVTTKKDYVPVYVLDSSDTTKLKLFSSYPSEAEDKKLSIKKAGKYSLSVDTKNLTYSCDRIPFDALWLIGSAAPQGWSLDNAASDSSCKMTRVDGSDCEWAWTGNLTEGELKFSCDLQRDWKGCWYMPTEADKAFEAVAEPYAISLLNCANDSSDRKWKVSAAGNYTIVINQKDDTILITKN